MLIPTVIEKSGRGEVAYDIYSSRKVKCFSIAKKSVYKVHFPSHN